MLQTCNHIVKATSEWNLHTTNYFVVAHFTDFTKCSIYCGPVFEQCNWINYVAMACMSAHVTSSAGYFVFLSATTKESVFRSLGCEIVLSSDSPATEGEKMVMVLGCSFEAFFSTTTLPNPLLKISICVLTQQHLLYYPPPGPFFFPPFKL